MKSFVKQSLAFMSGDTNGVISEQNYRTVDSGVDVQIAVLKASKVEAEHNIVNAEEELLKVKHPSTKITDVKYYFTQVKQAMDSVDQAKEKLETIKENIAFYEALKNEYNAEVETEA